MLEDLLKGILEGAVAQPQPRRSQSSGDPLQDLLGGILGGGAAPQQPAGGIGDLLEGILGGGTAPQQRSTSPAGGGMGDLLEAILGGGGSPQQRSSAPAGGLGGLLETILGGGGGLGSNSFLAPIIEGLAEKLGLPPAMAQMVVGFVLNKLLSGGLGGGMAPSPAEPSGGRGLPPAQPQGYDLDHLLDAMGSGQQVDPAYLRSSGMADELAQQTGLDPRMAERSLQEVFDMLGGQVATERRQVRQPTPGSLDSLLDTW